MINTILTKIIGTQNERELKRIRPIVQRIGELEPPLRALDDAGLAAKTVEFKERLAQGRAPGRPPARGLRGHARGRTPRAQHAALRRAAHRGHRPPPRHDRGDEDGRGQDPRGHARRLPERAPRQGRARRDRQRLPGQARQRVDGPDLPLPRAVRGRHPAPPGRPRAAGRLRGRHHLRDEQRVRLRLPARQHEVRPRELRPARPPLRDRGRGGLDPDRRGADAPHHQRPRRGVDRQVLPDQRHHPQAEAGRPHHRRQEGGGAGGAGEDRRLHRRREGEDGHPHRAGHGSTPSSCWGSRTSGTRRTWTCSTTSTRACARTRSSSATSTTW